MLTDKELGEIYNWATDEMILDYLSEKYKDSGLRFTISDMFLTAEFETCGNWYPIAKVQFRPKITFNENLKIELDEFVNATIKQLTIMKGVI